jgi:hypothetical protein
LAHLRTTWNAPQMPGSGSATVRAQHRTPRPPASQAAASSPAPGAAVAEVRAAATSSPALRYNGQEDETWE